MTKFLLIAACVAFALDAVNVTGGIKIISVNINIKWFSLGVFFLAVAYTINNH